ncbi:hypothetical protein ACVWXN_000525 [Bradyrhizobium sp. i1.4.4]
MNSLNERNALPPIALVGAWLALLPLLALAVALRSAVLNVHCRSSARRM